jgi:hypothetical protein
MKRDSVAAIASEGRWFRGCLHTHSTNSDGVYTPQQVVEWYRKCGYDFICLTDHDTFTDVSGFSTKDFLVLFGAEMTARTLDSGVKHHIIAVGPESSFEAKKERHHPQELIDRIKGAAGEAIVAHPYWTGSTVNDLSDLQGHLGLEVYNTSTYVMDGRGFSNAHWDQLLDQGTCTWGFAVDDSHWKISDAGGGWIEVNATKLERESILRALREGRFYSTSGPRIEEFTINEGVATLRCSPVKAISFLCRNGKGFKYRPVSEELLTGGEHRLSGGEGYLRVECIDAEGRCAWSNPVFF